MVIGGLPTGWQSIGCIDWDYGVIRYDHPSTFRTLLKNFANPEFSIALLSAANYTPGMFLKGSSHSSVRFFICESVKQWTFCRENMGFV